jgi:FkbM family methyltransferase
MADEVYTFGNGVSVYRKMLLDGQVKRYHAAGNPNLHEPVEEEWLSRLLADAPWNCVFADVGAGIGYYTILVRRLKPGARVFAVEPLPRHIEACPANFALNGLKEDDVVLLPLAIASKAGPVDLEDHRFGSRIAQPGDRNRVPVQAITLDDLVDCAGGRIDVMKMDIQGEELNVLAGSGALRKNGLIRSMIVGTHSAELHCGVLDLLAKCNYHLVFEDQEPAHQPDGIIVSVFPS